MRIILGVLSPDAGAVRWRGRPVDSVTRRRFGYMPEERGLYPKMRVRDQLAYLAELHGFGRSQARASAEHWIDALGLNERAGDPVEKLSLGNQQRVQLAAALVHDPELLVLDEPFSGLDPVGVDVLAGVLLGRAAAGVPVVFSSHQLELVERLCESVCIVARGKVVAVGSVAGLRATEQRQRARRLRLTVHGGASGWAAAMPGATVVEEDGDSAVLELAPAASYDEILDKARQFGSVREFAEVRPTLSELFREAVSA